MKDETKSGHFTNLDYDSLDEVARERDGHMFAVCNLNGALFRNLRHMLEQVSRDELLIAWLEDFERFFPKYHEELIEKMPPEDFEARKAFVKKFIEAKAVKNTKWLQQFRKIANSML